MKEKVKARIEKVGEKFADETVRLGITGLSRAGKTVFITSLVDNLLRRKNMVALNSALEGNILDVADPEEIQNSEIHPFQSEVHRKTLISGEWPGHTSVVSGLCVPIRVKSEGFIGKVAPERTVYLEMVDYPGEWLLDLALIGKSYSDWSRTALSHAGNRKEAIEYLKLVVATDGAAEFQAPESEDKATELADAWKKYLRSAKEKGYSDCTPGRFILSGGKTDDTSPRDDTFPLTFAPLPQGPLPQGNYPKGTLGEKFARQYEEYKKKFVEPFFKDHFKKIDRQIVLVDVLGAIAKGPWALKDLRRTMHGILDAFQPTKNPFLAAIMGPSIDRIFFAATKADLLHHKQHGELIAIMESLVKDAKQRAGFSGTKAESTAMAALCTANGERGKLPDPHAILYPVLQEGRKWLDMDFLSTNFVLQERHKWLSKGFLSMNFAPACLPLKADEGLPHIRLDEAAEFLLGDKLSP